MSINNFRSGLRRASDLIIDIISRIFVPQKPVVPAFPNLLIVTFNSNLIQVEGYPGDCMVVMSKETWMSLTVLLENESGERFVNITCYADGGPDHVKELLTRGPFTSTLSLWLSGGDDASIPSYQDILDADTKRILES